MNESAARQVLLVQAVESASDDATWSAEDRAWASRTALQKVGENAPAADFVAERARCAMQRLGSRAAGIGARPLWRSGWLLLAVLIGTAVGVLSDVIGSGQHINLLAPPVWAVIAWNLGVYALLLWGALGRRRSGGVRRRIEQWLARVRGGDTTPLAARFATRWAEASAPLNAARAALLMHAAALALALGLLAGLYLRALVLDYRAGWQSTYLDAGTVHGVLSTLLAPARAITGITLPDAAAMQALRVAPGGVASASAGPWIHLYAAMLGLLVVLPRGLLALWQGWRAHRLARAFPLDLQAPYFQRLLRRQHGGALAIDVRPYAHTPGEQAQLGLRAVGADVFGDNVRIAIAPTCAFGAEDTPPAPPAPGSAALVALFDLGATPEAEQQGRFVQALAAVAGSIPLLMLVDEAAFCRRFGEGSERHAQRRAAWRRLAESLAVPALFIDLDTPDRAKATAAVEAALNP